MSTPVISVDRLGKRYAIGRRAAYRSLRESLADAASAPLRALRSGGSRTNGDSSTFWSLRDVSFDIGQGEVVGIVGRNGAGKSTLLKILSRITDPTEGCVRIVGRVGSLLEVGTGFHPELTGRENIFLNGAILGMRKVDIERHFDEIVDFAEVEKFIDTPVKRYSSGMYVRLAFAVAAHLEPEILLVDEVLAVGDAGFQRKCLGKMGDVAKTGRTVLFVSHNMAAIQALCRQAILLEQGRLVARGPSAEVVERYLRQTADPDLAASHDLLNLHRDPGLRPILAEGYLNDAPLVGTHSFLPEEDLRFRLRLRLPHLMRQASVGIHFEDELGVRVYAVNTRWQLKGIELPEGVHTVDCLIPRPPLVPGRYHLSLGFSADGNQVDWLERIATVEFVKSDVYGTGELPQTGQGYFLSRADWTISVNEAALLP